MIDAMIRTLDEYDKAGIGIKKVTIGVLREVLLAGKEEPEKGVDLLAMFEQLERRVAAQQEHIHDLEKIIRDGEVFDAMNEVIRKIHNRVCDLEAGTKVKIGGYQELALRIKESNKRIGELEKKVGSTTRLEDLHTRMNAIAEAMASRLMDIERRVGTVENNQLERYKAYWHNQEDKSPVDDTLTAVTEGVSSGTTMSKPSLDHDCTKQSCSTCHDQHDPVPCDKPEPADDGSWPTMTPQELYDSGFRDGKRMSQHDGFEVNPSDTIQISRTDAAEFAMGRMTPADMQTILRKALKEGK
jgi:hypothetical protein